MHRHDRVLPAAGGANVEKMRRRKVRLRGRLLRHVDESPLCSRRSVVCAARSHHGKHPCACVKSEFERP